MEKGKQPGIWSEHNITGMASEAFARKERWHRAQELREALGRPDTVLEHKLFKLDNHEVVKRLDTWLDGYNLHLSDSDGIATVEEIPIRFFDAHETVTNDDASGISLEYSTSVIAVNVYRGRAVKARIGDVILFKMSAVMPGDPIPEPTVDDLRWGDNCVYGAIVKDYTTEWFKMTHSGDERVVSELRRKDPTEESGEVVDSKIVYVGLGREELTRINPNGTEAVELDMELDKFLESRRAKP